MTVFEVLGGAFAMGAFGWLKSYFRGRSEEGEARHDIPARAIGAAFVDREAARDIALIRESSLEMREDVGALRKLAEDRKEHDDEARVKQLAREAALEVARQQRETPGKR